LSKVSFDANIKDLNDDVEKLEKDVAAYTSGIAQLNAQGDDLKAQASERGKLLSKVNFANRIAQIKSKINDLVTDLTTAGVEVNGASK
jgi:predicted  nucleic acid-binding Zn-ribbon protein